MFTLCIVLSALSATFLPEDIDTIRSERLEEVVITSNSARQRIQNVQTQHRSCSARMISCVPSNYCLV